MEARAILPVCLPTIGNFGIGYLDDGDRSNDWRRPVFVFAFAFCTESVLVNCRFNVDGVCSSIIPVVVVIVAAVVVVAVVAVVTTDPVDGGSIDEIDCSTTSDVRGNNWNRIFFEFVVLGGEPGPMACASTPAVDKRGAFELLRPE